MWWLTNMMITSKTDSRFYKGKNSHTDDVQLLVKWPAKITFPRSFSPTWGIIAVSWEMFILLYMASLVRFSCGIIICWKETLVIFSNEPFLDAWLLSVCAETSAKHRKAFQDCGAVLNLGERGKKDITLGKIKIKIIKRIFPVPFSVKHCPQSKSNFPNPFLTSNVDGQKPITGSGWQPNWH